MLPLCSRQARDHGGANPPAKVFSHLEKCVGRSLKLLNIIEKVWAPIRKLFAPPWCPKVVTGLVQDVEKLLF